MAKRNEANERIKREYFSYLAQAQRYSEASVDAAAAAIDRFEVYAKRRDFKRFHTEQAIAFKRHLAAQPSARAKGALSKSTVRSTLNALRAFFHWLAGQPGYKSRFTYADADYFNPTDRDSRIALAPRPRPVPTLEQITFTMSLMPSATAVERRDRALLASILLTGCRDRAAVSLKLRHVDLVAGVVFQDPRDVETKFGKAITTYFFPVSEEALRIFTEWVDELKAAHRWGLDDPLFPATEIGLGSSHQFQPTGLQRRHWRNADPVRRIFKQAFDRAGLPYYNPHSFRACLARLGQERCRTPEELKAWSQNLGHEQMATTWLSYGRIEPHRQGEIIKALGSPLQEEPNLDLLADALAHLGRRAKSQS